MNKVLITGITGLVGSAFAVEILKRDENVRFVAITRASKDATAAERVKEVIIDQCKFDCTPEIAESLYTRIEVIEGDVSDPIHLAMSKKLDGVDTVFHCAADVNLGGDPEGKTYNVNYNGTKILLEIAKELKVKAFHYVSTAYVCGKNEGTVMEGESTATEWNNAYERSKFDSEKLVRSSGLPFSIYRPSIIVGRAADGKIRKPLAFYYILEILAVLKDRQCAKQHKEPSDVLDVAVRMQGITSDAVYFVPIDYLTAVTVELFSHPCSGKTYHLTGDSPVSTDAISAAIANTLKIKSITILDHVEDMTMDEKLIHRFIGEFLPYFGARARFDVSNIVEVFGRDSVEWHVKGDNLTQMIGSYYIENFPELTDVVL